MKALSIRQPWAWAILHCGKDIENRSWPTRVRGRVLIHAAKGMTSDDFYNAEDFIDERIGPIVKGTMPPFKFYERGGIVGSVEIVDCVTHSESRWFCGAYGFVLRNPWTLPFRPCLGALGFFEVPPQRTQ